MLDRGGDDVVAFAGVRFRHAFDRQVVGFRRAAGKYDLLRRRSDQSSHLSARLLHRLLRFPSETMAAAGGVSELLREIRQHRFQHARIERRGSVVVHINRAA